MNSVLRHPETIGGFSIVHRDLHLLRARLVEGGVQGVTRLRPSIWVRRFDVRPRDLHLQAVHRVAGLDVGVLLAVLHHAAVLLVLARRIE
jgi:hypothetical protein